MVIFATSLGTAPRIIPVFTTLRSKLLIPDFKPLLKWNRVARHDKYRSWHIGPELPVTRDDPAALVGRGMSRVSFVLSTWRKQGSFIHEAAWWIFSFFSSRFCLRTVGLLSCVAWLRNPECLGGVFISEIRWVVMNSVPR